MPARFWTSSEPVSNQFPTGSGSQSVQKRASTLNKLVKVAKLVFGTDLNAHERDDDNFG